MFEIVTDKKFDMIIMLFIGLNMLTMTMDHYNQTATFSNTLDYLNMIFICIFTSECLMKIFALRYHYFVEPWNLFDFVVVILSILGKVQLIHKCHLSTPDGLYGHLYGLCISLYVFLLADRLCLKMVAGTTVWIGECDS